MQALPFATIAFILYVAAAIWQGMTLFRRVPPRQGMVRLLGALGLLLHIPVVVQLVGESPGLLPGFTTSATLLMAVAVNVVLVAGVVVARQVVDVQAVQEAGARVARVA